MKPRSADDAAVRERDGSDVNSNQPAAVAAAEEAGYTVVHGDARTLLLDLDTAADETAYARRLPALQKHIAIAELERWRSKSAHLHVVLALGEPAPVVERLLMQACLGSDPVKEFLSLLRVREGNGNPSMLFRPGSHGSHVVEAE